MTRMNEVFDGSTLTVEDDRFDYSESRFIIGWLDDEWSFLCAPPRGESRRIISVRKANDREQTAYAPRLR